MVMAEDGQDGDMGPPGPQGATGPSGGGGGSVVGGTVEVNLGATPRHEGEFTIANGSLTPASRVLVWQACGPYTGKGSSVDESEWTHVSVKNVFPISSSARVFWQTPPSSGVPGAAAGLGGNYPRSRRINRVRGNVKFHYAIL